MTVTALRPPARPAPAVPLASVQGTLALDLRQPWEAPPPRPVSAPAGCPEPDDDRDEVTATVVAPRGRGADLDEVAQGFARALVEVIGGDRGAGQVLRWVSPEVYDQLLVRADLLTRTVPDDRRVRRLRSRLAGVRVSCPAPGVAELSIHLRRGERSHAVAARLEHRVQRRRGRLGAAWMCVALEIG
ncbi:Rv3235 family protein [Nocardioides marmoraquaticus]